MAAAPVGLSAGSEAFWLKATADYDLRPDELRILEDACREMDLIDTMSDALLVAPVLVKGSMGQQVMSPLFSEIRQHRTVLAALFRSLKLPDDAKAEQGVSQQRAAGVAKWQSKRGA